MHPLDVFITVETEAWPRTLGWRSTRLRDDVDRDVEGRTSQGSYGIGYQMDALDAHGLKGVFLVESLFACFTGPDPLRDIVSRIQDRGHEVQPHVHPEWLDWMPEPLLRERRRRNLAEFTEAEQYALIGRAPSNLRDAGARNVSAFRAGNYGADCATLHALARIRYDSSYNYCYLDRDCRLHLPEPLLQPAEVEGICEIPVSLLSDSTSQNRHAQLCACSHHEIRRAMLQAHEAGRRTFVIALNSFELLRRGAHETAPDPVVIRRFDELCRFLAENRDKFRTTGFNDLAVEHDQAGEAMVPASPFSLTTTEISEPLARHMCP